MSDNLYSPPRTTLLKKSPGVAQSIFQYAKSLLLAVIIGSSCIGFTRALIGIRFSPLDQWLAIPCFYGLAWAMCRFKVSYLPSLLTPKSPLFLAFLFAVAYDVVSRYLQFQKIEYPFLLHTFIQLASAFFIGYLRNVQAKEFFWMASFFFQSFLYGFL